MTFTIVMRMPAMAEIIASRQPPIADTIEPFKNPEVSFDDVKE